MSTETKFTKGEWYTHPNGVGCGGIAIVNTPNGCVLSKEEDIANQDLIATAPEMYTFIESLIAYRVDEDELYRILAKARGELV